MNPLTLSLLKNLIQSCLSALWVCMIGLLFLSQISVTAQQKASVKKPTPAIGSDNAFGKAQEAKIWLSLDVVEHQYNSSGTEIGKEKYRSDIDIQVIDSATNRTNTVHSGETLPLQPRRTYYILLPDVPQSYGMTTRLAGTQTQVLRTPKAVGDDDIMFERKFVLNSRPGSGTATAREMGKSMNIPSSAFPKQQPTGAYTNMKVAPNLASTLGNPNYYVIQYCSLKSQDDALQARSFLMRSGIRDARVEVYIDKFGQSYYRLRSGSYIDPALAKSAIESNLWKNRQALGLKQKPIVVKAGV